MSKVKILEKNKTKMAKIWDQKRLIWIFWDRIFKTYSHILNQHPEISKTAKFCERKTPKFLDQNCFIGIFLPKMSHLGEFWGGISKQYCHI